MLLGRVMGKRGPKPTRELTTHIRIPVSIAEALKNAATSRNVSIAVLIEGLKEEILGLLPMPPSEGPPLPRRMGIRWSTRTKKRS